MNTVQLKPQVFPMLTFRSSTVRIALTMLVFVAVTGCAGSGNWCIASCGSRHSGSTPLAAYLYPQGDVPKREGVAELQLPIRVGLAFLPARGSAQVPDATQRLQILEGIRARFRKLEYVREIVIIPDQYLVGSQGFTGLMQVSRLLDVDLVGLVSYDQVTQRNENRRSFFYLTVLGAYLVNGTRHETHTLLDLAVVEPASRSLLLRAGGIDATADSTTAVGQGIALRKQQAEGLNRAAAQLNDNFALELGEFSERVKRGDAPVKVTHRASPSGGAGATGVLELLGALGLGIALRLRRRVFSRH
jgi:rhombotail lipoprotein